MCTEEVAAESTRDAQSIVANASRVLSSTADAAVAQPPTTPLTEAVEAALCPSARARATRNAHADTYLVACYTTRFALLAVAVRARTARSFASALPPTAGCVAGKGIQALLKKRKLKYQNIDRPTFGNEDITDITD